MAFSVAARTATAVPCWSSWSTGISSASTSRRSTSKQTGDSMSSSWIAPKPWAMCSTVSTISSGSRVSSTIGKAERPTNWCSSAALPSITGSDATGPTLPRPSTRVPLVTMATVLPRMVKT